MVSLPHKAGIQKSEVIRSYPFTVFGKKVYFGPYHKGGSWESISTYISYFSFPSR